MGMQLSETASCVGECLMDKPARARRMNLRDGCVTKSFQCWLSTFMTTEESTAGALL